MKKDSLKDLRKNMGVIGLYIIQCLELRTLAKKKIELEVSDAILAKIAKEIDVPNLGVYGALSNNHEPYKYLRLAIASAVKSGYIEVLKVKDKSFIKFPHLKRDDKTTVLSAIKSSTAKRTSASKPTNTTEVAEYMLEYKKNEMDKEVAEKEANAFYDYWQEKGWARKSGEIKDWKATVRRWMNSDYRKTESLKEGYAQAL
jgi:hypothetical protein